MDKYRDRREYQKQYRRLKGNQINAKRRLLYKKDKKYRNKLKIIALEHYERNKTKILEYKKCLPEHIKLSNRNKANRYYRKHRNKLLEQTRQRRYANPELYRKRLKEYNKKRKIYVLRKYGGCCANPFCKEEELAVLTIDHINDDGYKERKLCDCNNYYKLRRLPKRPDLQVLCMSCQLRKKAYGPDFNTWESKKEFLSTLPEITLQAPRRKLDENGNELT